MKAWVILYERKLGGQSQVLYNAYTDKETAQSHADEYNRVLRKKGIDQAHCYVFPITIPERSAPPPHQRRLEL